MPKKPVGILKRNARTAEPSKSAKPRRLIDRAANVPKPDTKPGTLPAPSKPEPVLQEPRQYPFWTCQSEVDRQAAACLSKILASDANKRNGKTIKSLTLAPHIKAKKAVYAVTCQTLACKYATKSCNLCTQAHVNSGSIFVTRWQQAMWQSCENTFAVADLPVIQQVLSKTTLLNVEQLRPAVAFVITYELLFGQVGSLQKELLAFCPLTGCCRW